MSDLLTDKDVQDFSEAMRSISDTFNKYTVTFETVDLEVGLKDITTGLKEKDHSEEIDTAYRISINYDYLQEKGLIDEKGLLIGYDTPVVIDEKKFSIINIKNGSIFRDKVMSVLIEVVR